MGIEANARHVAEELLRDACPDMTAAACEPLAGLKPVGEVPATLSARFVGQVVDEVSHSICCFREYLPSADVMLTSDDGSGQGMFDVLARIGRTVALLRPTAAAPIASACEYVVQNIETDPGIKDVAAHLFLNDKYLGSLFHKQTGMTYAVWVKRVRLERAKSLLSQGGMRIGEVARRLGYQDVEYFGRMFRRQTGFLPSRYVWRCDDDCAPVAAPPRSCSLPQSSLLVGVVGCLTGPNGYLFGTSRYMYELAARHINDAGGVPIVLSSAFLL